MELGGQSSDLLKRTADLLTGKQPLVRGLP
jgi:hypothetical protein